jgi:TonB-linked SusC/RagA family outer membrane protein
MLMSLKKLLSAFLCFTLVVLSQSASAQDRTVTGKVTDSKDGSPVVGASVQPKGAKTGTATRNDGTFSLSVSANTTNLIISSIGFATQEVSIEGKSSVEVSLAVSAISNLNEVVVTGYGTRKVKDATGSVAAITTKDFNKGVISTPEQLLQGRTPGVIVSPSSGEPGAAATINIRGSASIRSSQEPLYVIDGVPISPGGTSGIASGIEGSSTPKNPLAFLNPNDIESISILKDASSAAIYGSRGANGVILITTKSGKGKSHFTFGATTSVSTVASRYNLLKPADFLYQVKKANIESGASEANAAAAVATVDHGASTDWQDQIFRTGISQNYNLGWGFSSKGSALRLSGSYDQQKGIIEKSSLKRLTGRANFSQKLFKDKFKFETALTYSNVKNEFIPLTNNAGYQGSLIGAVIAFNPTNPIKDKNGNFFDLGDGNRNPSQMLAYFDDNDENNRFLGNVSGSYEVIKGLVLKTTFGYDNSKNERLSFADPRLTSAYGGTNNVFGKDLGNGITGNGRTVKNNVDLESQLFEATATYDRAFNNGHVINAVVGYGYGSTVYQYKGKVGWGLTTPVTQPGDVFVKDFNNFKNYYDFVSDYTKFDGQSFFGRVNYTINDKYLFTATARQDGSSKFGKNNKYGFFPAFAAKWKIMNENFAVNSIRNLFSDLSIRVNYGKLGSQDGIGAYDAVDLQQTWIGNSGNNETQFIHQGNKDLKWEEATTTGAGIDFSLKKIRLSGTIDFYSTKRENLLFFAPTPGGFSTQAFYWVNLPGAVINRGWEFSFNYRAVDAKKFKWDVNYNMTFIHNELKDFNVVVNTGGISGQGLTGAYAQTFENGYPLFAWKMPVFLGFDGNGVSRYADDANPKIVGSALPKFLAGLTNSFTYGNWNASIFLNAVTGFKVYNNTANALLIKGSVKTAHNIDYASAGTTESPLNAAGPSTRFLEKGDFLRLSNAFIGYTFNLKNDKYIKSLSVNASGQNLALFTNYSGLDPEVNVDKQLSGVPSRGFDYAGYPKARTFTLGVNVGF